MSKANYQLEANNRTVVGRKVKQLRKEGLLPATIYGKGMEAISIQTPTRAVEKLYDNVGESSLIDLIIDDKKLPILLRNPQYHPLNGELIHIDCYKVNLKEKITTFVPIEFIGESQAVKDGNTLVEVTDEIEVEALPTDLPENVEVDISKLVTVDDVITVEDLVVDKSKVEILTSPDQVIVKIEVPKEEEEIPVEEQVAPGEVPATAQKEATEEGEESKSKEESEK